MPKRTTLWFLFIFIGLSACYPVPPPNHNPVYSDYELEPKSSKSAKRIVADVDNNHIDFGREYHLEVEGFSLKSLAGYKFEQEGATVLMTNGLDAERSTILVRVLPLTSSTDPDVLVDEFLTRYGEELIFSQKPVPIEVNGATGLESKITLLDTDGSYITGRVIGLKKGGTAAIIFGSAQKTLWETKFEAQLEAVLSTIKLYPLPEKELDEEKLS